MPDFIGLDCWEDEEPARRYDEWESGWSALDEEQEPPPACASCGDEPQGCCVCRQGRPLTDDDADDPGFGRPR